VYFVAENADVVEREGQQQLCGRFTTCMELSVANSLEAERKRPESSFLGSPPASWIEVPLLIGKARPTEPLGITGSAEHLWVCFAHPTARLESRVGPLERLCRPCFADQEWDSTMNGLPIEGDFMRYVTQWLQSPSDEFCPLGGQAPYSSAVRIAPDNASIVASP
jgi:Niemann-Pick C1 protein